MKLASLSVSAGLAAATVLASHFASVDAAASDLPFQALAGAWSGGGQIKLSGGQSERLSCRAYYTPKDNGTDLGMSIRCASPSYKIELRSALKYAGGNVTGTWEERTFNAAGEVTGKAAAGSIAVAFSGAVSGSMTVTYAGTSQKVAINTTGTELSAVSLTLSKG